LFNAIANWRDNDRDRSKNQAFQINDLSLFLLPIKDKLRFQNLKLSTDIKDRFSITSNNICQYCQRDRSAKCYPTRRPIERMGLQLP
jgi:hypothetical protein